SKATCSELHSLWDLNLPNAGPVSTCPVQHGQRAGKPKHRFNVSFLWTYKESGWRVDQVQNLPQGYSRKRVLYLKQSVHFHREVDIPCNVRLATRQEHDEALKRVYCFGPSFGGHGTEMARVPC